MRLFELSLSLSSFSAIFLANYLYDSRSQFPRGMIDLCVRHRHLVPRTTRKLWPQTPSYRRNPGIGAVLQKRNFAPNWIIRDVFCVLVMTPKLASLMSLSAG